MPYSPFHEKFSDLAKRETRSVTIYNHPNLPPDEYGLLEMYCDEPDCDCRRVMFSIVSKRTSSSLAYIAYGWESERFYADWFRTDNPAYIREMQGPILNSMSSQSKLAPHLLPLVEEVLLDEQYVERLKQHYALYRNVIEKEATASPKRRKQKHRKKRKKRR